MEYCPVCETLAQATSTTAAAAIHRRVASCERLFHASCTCNKSSIANDGVTLPENRSTTSEELALPPSSPYIQPNEDCLSSTDVDDTTLHDDSSIEDPLVEFVEIVEGAISNMLEQILILPFLLKNKKTFIKIGMIF